MGTWKSFEEIEAWKKARILAQLVYRTSSIGRFSRDFDLTAQIRRSSGSVMDNIAEGFGRGGKGEFIQYLGFAKGSLDEVKSQLVRASDYGYLQKAQFEEMQLLADEVGKIICGLIRYLNRTHVRGQRYKK